MVKWLVCPKKNRTNEKLIQISRNRDVRETYQNPTKKHGLHIKQLLFPCKNNSTKVDNKTINNYLLKEKNYIEELHN